MDQEFPPIREQDILPEDVDYHVEQENQYFFFMERCFQMAGDDNAVDPDLEEEIAFHNEDFLNASFTSADYDEAMDEPSPSAEP